MDSEPESSPFWLRGLRPAIVLHRNPSLFGLLVRLFRRRRPGGKRPVDSYRSIWSALGLLSFGVAWASLTVVMCLSVGMAVPTRTEAHPADGRWMWVVGDAAGFHVGNRRLEPCGTPIFVGLDVGKDEGLGMATAEVHRAWVIDRCRDLSNPAFKAAVRAYLAGLPGDTRILAHLLDEPSMTSRSTLWPGLAAHGATLAIPSVGLVVAGLLLVTRLREAVCRWRAFRNNRCVQCAYDLSGLEEHPRPTCPECGSVRCDSLQPDVMDFAQRVCSRFVPLLRRA